MFRNCFPLKQNYLCFSVEIPSNMDAQQLRKVWDDFAVGESGFLNLLQLSTVCDYIGMGNLEDEDLELLFNELDTDRDGFVSFKEFYTGILHANTEFKKGMCESEKSCDMFLLFYFMYAESLHEIQKKEIYHKTFHFCAVRNAFSCSTFCSVPLKKGYFSRFRRQSSSKK